jgi:hypothetical protein
MRKTRTIFAAALVCALFVCTLASCKAGGSGGSGEAKDALSGDTKSVGEQVISGAKEDQGGASFPEYLDNAVTPESSKGMLGLEPEAFSGRVSEATAFTAAINAIAGEIAVVKCASAGDAAEVKKLIAEGFDPAKWICARPEQCFVIDSGSYVLLFAGSAEQAGKIQASFDKLANGQVGEANVFFKDAGGGNGASVGGIGLAPPTAEDGIESAE